MVFPVFGGMVKNWNESFEVEPNGNLIVEADIGSIRISTGGNNRILADIEAEVDTRNEDKAQAILDRFQVKFEQRDNSVIITLEYDRDGWSFLRHGDNFRSIDINVSVPVEYDVELSTAGGGISVEDLKGDIDAETSGGSLHFYRTDGPINGHTSGGGISLNQCQGKIDIETSGGGIEINQVDGVVEAHTSGGGIDIDDFKGSIDASTSGGGISASFIGQPEDDCQLTTSGGGIEIYLDKNANINIDAETSIGRVETDFPITLRGRIDKSSIRGEINDGGPEIYLRTSAGNIYIYEN